MVIKSNNYTSNELCELIFMMYGRNTDKLEKPNVLVSNDWNSYQNEEKTNLTRYEDTNSFYHLSTYCNCQNSRLEKDTLKCQ